MPVVIMVRYRPMRLCLYSYDLCCHRFAIHSPRSLLSVSTQGMAKRRKHSCKVLHMKGTYTCRLQPEISLTLGRNRSLNSKHFPNTCKRLKTIEIKL